MLDVNQLLIPILQMFFIVASQQLYQHPMNNLDLSISVRMESGGILQLGIHSLPNCCPKSAQESPILIRYDGG